MDGRWSFGGATQKLEAGLPKKRPATKMENLPNLPAGEWDVHALTSVFSSGMRRFFDYNDLTVVVAVPKGTEVPHTLSLQHCDTGLKYGPSTEFMWDDLTKLPEESLVLDEYAASGACWQKIPKFLSSLNEGV